MAGIYGTDIADDGLSIYHDGANRSALIGHSGVADDNLYIRSFRGQLILRAEDTVGNAGTYLSLQADDSAGTVRTRQRIDGPTGDMNFYKADGSTISLLWDESDDRWEFSGNVGIVLPVKTDTGDPATPAEGQMIVNTSDNNVQVYADGAWRTLASW